jgi:hypothetical protein
MEKAFTDVSLEFSHNGNFYEFFLTSLPNNLYQMKIKKPFDVVFWIKIFNLESLQQENIKWKTFEDNKGLLEFILESVKLNECNLVITEKELIFKIWMEMQKGKLKQKVKFSLNLGKNKYDTEEKIGEISTQLQKLIKSLEKKKFCIFNGAFSPTNNSSYALSNENKTLQKISGGTSWYGIKCAPLGNNRKYVFSIKINETDGNCQIMMGFCLSNANPQSGFYATNSAFMFYLSNGNFYHRSSSSTFCYGLIGKKNDVFSAMIDIPKKTMILCLNGYRCGFPKTLDLKDEEMDSLCPSVDVYAQNCMITLEEYDSFEEFMTFKETIN